MTQDQKTQDVLIMADRIARLYYWVVKNLVEELGEKRAEELVEKIILDYGK